LTVLRVDSSNNVLHAFGDSIACSIGKTGVIAAADKREGDGKSPLGCWPVRAALLRPGRVTLPGMMMLPWRWIRPQDGWSDDPADPAYNRPVAHPHGFSAEKLWRDDGLYDVIIVLGHNDAPPVAGLGSAVFLHCRREERPTLGCIAIDRDRLINLLPRLTPADVVEIG